jgi:hypothetical protein
MQSCQQLQYFCSKCNILLKETEKPIDGLYSHTEECPGCGSLLWQNIKRTTKSDSLKQQLPKLQTAYDIKPTMLTIGVDSMDRLLNLTTEDRVLIAGKHANTLLTRLCVCALMSERHGGLESPSVIFVDAGNSSDIYQCVNFARQYGLDIKKVLQNIIVSRPFTVDQLDDLVANELQKVILRSDARMVVISNLLRMFLEEPHHKQREAERLIGEITRSIMTIPRNILVIVSLHYSLSDCDKTLLSLFTKTITIENSTSNRLKVSLYNHNHHGHNQLQIPEKALRIVLSRRS